MVLAFVSAIGFLGSGARAQDESEPTGYRRLYFRDAFPDGNGWMEETEKPRFSLQFEVPFTQVQFQKAVKDVHTRYHGIVAPEFQYRPFVRKIKASDPLVMMLLKSVGISFDAHVTTYDKFAGDGSVGGSGPTGYIPVSSQDECYEQYVGNICEPCPPEVYVPPGSMGECRTGTAVDVWRRGEGVLKWTGTSLAVAATLPIYFGQRLIFEGGPVIRFHRVIEGSATDSLQKSWANVPGVRLRGTYRFSRYIAATVTYEQSVGGSLPIRYRVESGGLRFTW
jgi:hypothetical protein